MKNDIAVEFATLLASARDLSTDVRGVVEEILQEGLDAPLSPDEAAALLTRVVKVIRERADARRDPHTVAVLDRSIEALVSRIEETRKRIEENGDGDAAHDHDDEPAVMVELQAYNGIKPQAVRPSPVFHEREVAVTEGFIRTRDIKLWDGNERLDIHLNQFQQAYGRKPNAEELLAIMQGSMPLAGIDEVDQFGIQSLAKSIAVNGVRKPPIIDTDGTLLDGNRRVTACYLILNSTTFTAEERQRAEWLKVWQLTPHATESDRDSVIVSLNFEPDYKQDWPEYVKARKVYDEWEGLLALEPRANPTASRQKEIRKSIARRFALATDEVSRYINMVKLATEFEDYHVNDRNKDQYAAKHRAADKFQYFDELNKGKNPGGVNWALNADENFKNLVFDLLYENKFQDWKRIRDLKHVAQNDEAVGVLRQAREQPDLEVARELVDDAISLARTNRAEQRQAGANTRIRVFAEWFADLPVKSFKPDEPGAVTAENLMALHNVLKLVENYLGDDNIGGGSGDGAHA
ncbi:MAG: hypothetical protein KJ587_07225 [Alphaproteobacteria bacterium]|nr:hypothetical protein [Alphaproteobacteria bacterium]